MFVCVHVSGSVAPPTWLKNMKVSVVEVVRTCDMTNKKPLSEDPKPSDLFVVAITTCWLKDNFMDGRFFL